MNESAASSPLRMNAPGSPSSSVLPNRTAFSHKMIIYRDFVRLGEWTRDEIESLYAEGLLYLSDCYCRMGMQERTPIKTLFAKPEPKQSIFTKSVFAKRQS